MNLRDNTLLKPDGFWFDLQAAVYGVVIEKFEGEWLIFPACPDPFGVQETLPLLESYLSQ